MPVGRPSRTANEERIALYKNNQAELDNGIVRYRIKRAQKVLRLGPGREIALFRLEGNCMGGEEDQRKL
jgi:hypothetical protein